MKCVMCGSELKSSKIGCDRIKEGRIITFENIPALVCLNCGEQYVDEKEINFMDQTLQEKNLSRIILFE